jgi:hypothetical protein
MRGGRPCNCGCDNCEGYNCNLGPGSWTCDEIQNHLSFYEPFDDPIQSDWVTGQITQFEGRGVPSSGDYLYDYVEGTAISSPLICFKVDESVTIFSDNTSVGFARFGMDGGPDIRVEGSEATLTLPNGTGVVVDSGFQSGDRYHFYLNQYPVPVSTSNQLLSVWKYRNSSFFCETGGQFIEGTGDCNSYKCLMYTKTFVGATGDTLYSVNSPFMAYLEESGNWEFDQFCVQAADVSNSKLVPFGIENVSIPVTENIGELLPTFDWACDNILDRPYYVWKPNCVGVPYQSGQDPHLLWSALRDDWLTNVDGWRCDGTIPLGSSANVYLRTEVGSYEVDMLQPNIWHLVPVAAEQTFSCQDPNPFDEESGCDEITFTGIPCNESNCYSYPFLSFDNGFWTGPGRFNEDQGNVSLANGGQCPQVGNIYTNGTYYFNRDTFLIPRDDNYSVFRHYKLFGESNDYMDYSNLNQLWSVEKLAYTINWDSTNRWWTGNFRFLEGSGTDSVFEAGGPAALNQFLTGADLSKIYKNGSSCNLYNLYLYDRCHNQTFVDILDGSGNLLASTPFRITVAGIGEIAGSLTNTSRSYDENGVGPWHKFLNDELTRLNSYILPSICNLSRTYSITGGNGDTTCQPSGCPDPSGGYSLELKAISSYKLTDGSPYSPVPGVLISPLGGGALRDMNTFNTAGGVLGGIADAGVGFKGMSEVYSSDDFPGKFCITSTVKQKVYKLDSDWSTSLLYPVSDKVNFANSFFMPAGAMPEGVNNLPYWNGLCQGRVKPLFTTSFDWIDPLDFIDPSGFDSGLVLSADRFMPISFQLFIDKNANELYGFCRGGIGDNLPYPTPDDWYDPPSSFYKSETDINRGSYFAHKEVISTSPLKIRFIQTFMALGNPDDGTLETGCNKYKFYPYGVEVIVEEPTYI